MGVLITCKNEEDPFKNEAARVVTTDLPLKVYADFYDAQGKITSQTGIGSTFNSNSSKCLWLSLLPARMKKILFVFVALRPMSTAMVIAGRSVHLTTLFSWAGLLKRLTSNLCTYFRLCLTTTLLEINQRKGGE